MRTKTLLISSCAVLAAIATLAFTFLIYRFLMAPFGYERAQMPAELSQPRVVLGDSVLTRSQFINTDQLGLTGQGGGAIGPISDLAVGEFDPHQGPDVVIAGSNGAVIADQKGAIQSHVSYEFEKTKEGTRRFTSEESRSSLGDLKIIDVDGDGVCEYLARGSLDGAALFNHQGKRLWSYGKPVEGKLSVRDVTASDLDGDGVVEFIASWDGLEAFDLSGKRVWATADDSHPLQIEVVDIDGSGTKRIVSIGSHLVIRDKAGKQLRSVDSPGGYLGRFSLCSMPGISVPTILAVNDSYLWLINFDGKAVAKFNAPLSDFPDVVQHTPLGDFHSSVYASKGVWVKLVKDLPEFLAVVARFSNLARSNLYIYEHSGKLVYQEVLPEESSAIAVLPPETPGGVSELLIGGTGTVWRYTPK